VASGVSCLILFPCQKQGGRIPQFTERRLRGAADNEGVYAVVMMGQQVSQACDLPPRDLRLPRKQVRGQRLHRLADHHQPVQQGVECQLRLIFRTAGLGSLQRLNCPADPLGSFAASIRLRWPE
jgi:hypothetical protein